MKTCLAAISLLLFGQFTHAQLSAEDLDRIDSLKNVIESNDHDTSRILALLAWDDMIYLFDPELDKELNEKMKAICESGLKRKISEEEKRFYQVKLVGSHNNLGLHYYDKSDYPKALEYFNHAVRISDEMNDDVVKAKPLANIGLVYADLREFQRAMRYFRQSYEFYKKYGDDNMYGMSTALNNIGNQHADLEDLDSAAYYYEKSLEYKIKLGDRIGEAHSLNNLGTVYGVLYDTASLKGDTELAEAYFHKALDYVGQALEIRDELGDQKGIAAALLNFAVIHRSHGDLEMAMDYGHQGLAIAELIEGKREELHATHLLYSVYADAGMSDDALLMYERYIAVRDTIQQEENQKELIRFEFERRSDSAQAEQIRKDALAAATRKREKAIAQKDKERKNLVIYFGAAGLVLVLIFSAFVVNRLRLTRRQKEVIEGQKEVVEQQKQILEDKNREITDSIQYAKRIQAAILPPGKTVEQYLPDSFVLYLPKDIVAGDFYWLEHVDGKTLYAAADCTGHGVPGAMVSVICNNGLNRSVREHGLVDPGEILNKTREIVLAEFEKSEEEVRDGMDIALVHLDGYNLKFAGAHNPLWIIRDGELTELRGDKQPIGKYVNERPFETKEFTLQPGDTLYAASDGYIDQFGGERGKKFKASNLKKLLLSIQSEVMSRQHEILKQRFEEWRGDLEQLDDICIIGVRV